MDAAIMSSGPPSSSSSSSSIGTVGRAVAALVDTYATALQCHAAWRSTQRARNHYHYSVRRAAADADAGISVDGDSKSDADADAEAYTGVVPPEKKMRGGMCAASASLTIAKRRVEDAFEKGADVLGEEFVAGDEACRDVLLENLSRLHESVEELKHAVEAETRPLPLASLIFVSEAVRAACLAALHKQYQRLAVGRLVPRLLSPPAAATAASRRPSAVNVMDESEAKAKSKARGECDDDDASVVDVVDIVDRAQTQTPTTERLQTSPGRLSRGSSTANHEPPSPPLTPTRVKERVDAHTPVDVDVDTDHEIRSTYSRSTAKGHDPRPMNSVFSVFCPEAMKYQVDLEKALPIQGTKCGCGYDWNNAGASANDRAVMVIKDGFQITPRFLGKSHCQKGLGCVLCTSSGRTETFGSIEGLKAHINSSHTKWQLLHDRDLAGR
ncbi:hypothetical protein F4777DRAFT_442777 [Nemania sp. FL0916]|nr:hypothetical protein F4777DRAFT_442777 [Nemania sp. FL0916]